ncbi:uncharacterized protein [Acropora muricata]|uniref:uncharacterized protein isoform X3 n=1 Tax=Acropora muricata TaxID=159855 RepID=UPI0034E51DF7
MDYTVDVEPLKATFLVKEVFQNGVFKLRGIASAVYFKGQVLLITSSAVVEATNDRKKHIAERFSRKHVGGYRLDVSILGQRGDFTFLSIMKEYPRAMRTGWVISLNLELPSSKRKAQGYPLSGTGEFKLQFQWDGSTQVIPTKPIDWTSIVGVPIIIKNKLSNKNQSGRFSVIGVVGSTREEKLCLCYLNDKIIKDLDKLLSNLKGAPGPTDIEELVAEETSTAQTQAIAAINLREQGPSASLEAEDQRSLRQCGVLRQFGNLTFLWITKEYQRVMGTSWIVALDLEIPSSERKALGLLLPGTGAEKCELQVQWDDSTQVIPTKSIDWTSIVGVPIIIENTQGNKKQCGQFSVIGVVGSTREEKLCLCYLDHENTGSLDKLLSKLKGAPGPADIEELVAEETSTAQAQAVAAINLREQGPSSSLETEDQRSLRECGETVIEEENYSNCRKALMKLPSTSSGIDHVQPVFELVHMAADENDFRLLLSQELEAIRPKIVRGELVLFVGEQLSTLVTPENQSPSLDDWWRIVNHPPEDGFKALLDLEEKFLRSLQLAPSRVHNVLRNVGNFPLIMTTNMDELLERFLWKTRNSGEKIRLDQISCLAKSWPDPRRDVVIKCLGDASFNARVLPSSKKYFEDFCDSQENAEVEFIRQLFNERSILFLGCDPNRVEYMNFFRKFAVSAQMKHYKFETHSKSDLEKNGNLLTVKADLQPWEFVQLLSTGTIEEEIQPGKVYERSYLRHQHAEYLQQQLALEKMASEIVFHTISITNALSPNDFFEQVSLPTIQNIFTEDPFGVYSKEKVERTMDAMKARRNNLIEMIKESKTNVTALFFYHGVKNEIELWRKAAKSVEEKQKNLNKCRISINRYAMAILLCKSPLRHKSSLEIRIVGDQETYKVQEVEKETFALIRLKGGQGEAICYAETATSPQDRKFANHLININGGEVLNKRRIYERSRANAWSNENSIFMLANALIKENKEGFGSSAIDKNDLEKLATLARVSLKVRSQLDLDSFERLAAGNFGEVFKAERKGNSVAVKILKNVENVKQIEYYEREVDLLSKAKHPNIVGVIGCLAIDNNLAIVMELVLGGNLKQFLKKDLKVAEKKEFTVRFVEHIGSAIEHLHSLDIIHRDVKPDNILLSKDQKVLKLGDFGIARATEGTEQTKTMMGSYRYMAPEVGMAVRCRYSKRADVYSFGLCLIEVLSQGKVVFAHIADYEAVMDRKKHGEKPHIPEISVDEFGEELATKLKGITEECLRPESSRPEMSRVLRMLRGELTAKKGTVELYCIGTGTGTTAVVHRQPSSSVIIYYDGKPLLLADIGAGVLKPCMEKLGHPHSAFPRNVFISHNHMDHSGELPLLLAFESMRKYKAKEPKLRVLCGPEVEHKLKTKRLDELLSTSYTPEQIAEWIVCKPDGDPTYLDDAKQFFIKIYRTLHSEVCYGFLLHFKDKPILGYLVDSGFKEDVYEFFFQASTVVVDARENGNKDHASFAEVVDYVKKHEFKRSKVYITGYGIDTEYPLEGLPEVEPLRPEQYITLWEEDMENAEH